MAALVVLLGGLPAHCASKPVEVAPRAMKVLRENCLSCHNSEKIKGGLTLSTRESVLKGGENGPAAVVNKPDASKLIQLVSMDGDPHMPPKKQLSTNQVATLRRWVAAGLPWDAAALTNEAPARLVKLGEMPASYHPVLAMALSPEESRLAVGRGGKVLVFDLVQTNHPVVGEWTAHSDSVRALAWKPDGKSLASGAFGEVKTWDASNPGGLLGASTQPVGRVTALHYGNDGAKLFAADGVLGEGGWIRVFTEGLTPAFSWRAHDDLVTDFSLSADGRQVVTASGDKMVKIWTLQEKGASETGRMEGHTSAVTGAAFNTNATEVVTVGMDKALYLWDAATRQSIVTINGRKRGFNTLVWAANSSLVVAADDEGRLFRFRNFKRHTGEQSSETAEDRELPRAGSPIHSLAISKEGKTIYSGDAEGVVRVMDLEGKILATFNPPASPAPSTNAPSFVRDVLPAMAKAGCMAGGCHAKPEGQNGFKLSVFSYDPHGDFAEIVQEGKGRRILPAAPEESLLVLKPLLAVEHGGGRRFEPGSPTHKLLVDWIRGGMLYQHTNEPALVGIEVEPKEKVYRKGGTRQLKVQARYTDGSIRDVTKLADFVSNEKEMVQVSDEGLVKAGSLSGESVVVVRYMGYVSASRVTIPAERTLPASKYAKLPSYNFVDDLAVAQFKRLGLFPSELCTDNEFFRRAHLDIIGTLPSAEETQEFLKACEQLSENEKRNLRSAVVERLLQRPEFGDYWANKWADLLRPNPDRVGIKSVYLLDQWLRESFKANKPYDQFVRDILLAEGTNHREGPIVVYRDRREPPELTTMFSQLFLGVRMECAKCHHHPNEKWSQDDFYQFAAYFGPLRQKGAGLSPPISAGTEAFYYGKGREVRHPVTDEVMKPKPPDGPATGLQDGVDPRLALVAWLTNTNNPFFARAGVNRVWATMFGRGFVEPVDDFRSSNPASNEQLLNALAADFTSHGYDLKQLIRTIANSRLYQLSSTPNEFNKSDGRQFSRSYRRRLPAEVMLDAVSKVTGTQEEFNGLPSGSKAMLAWSYKVQSHFLDAFGRPNPSSDCPCERDLRTSVVQSLHMMNSRGLQEKLANENGRVKELAASPRPPSDIVTELYLSSLGRTPTEAELKAATEPYLKEKADRRKATEDVLWALLNSAEFFFNH